MLKNLEKPPFPYFGGKSDAAPHVWAALGDVAHYVEPFCGSLAVLLRRPHPCNRPYFSESVNDSDGLLVNVWRSIQQCPDETAEWASWPVTEVDMTARQLWLLKWKSEKNIERLAADPTWCDPQAAGYWMYGICAWIGGGWCDGTGPWIVSADGRIAKRDNKGNPGVNRKRPHLCNGGTGINRPAIREPGVAQEPGVKRKIPRISNTGQGINHPGTQEPGVAQAHEHDAEWEWDVSDFHQMTMPELRRWFAFLSARLRHVRILNGDWARLCTSGALKILDVRMGKGVCGIFLDPPYGHAANRYASLYAHESLDVAGDVLQWCIENGNDPKYRIVLAGFEGEHDILAEQYGWKTAEWFKNGFLKGGMKNLNKEDGSQQARERLWLSPNCLGVIDAPQSGLFVEG